MAAALIRPPLAAEPWHAVRAAGDENAAARIGQPDAFLLFWAESTLREALSRSPRLAGRPYEIFAQGSRANNTYIEQASDIDLILMLEMPFEPDGAGRYGWEEFRDDALAVLGESYTVRMGRRCLNVDDSDSLFGQMVDILVATEHRRYPAGDSGGGYEQGVFFRDNEGRPIVNFPKQHRRNGDEKDRRTGGRFKEVVRAAKRVRRRAEREGMIAGGAAPSYLLECLLYNVPDHVYRAASLGPAYRGALEWLRRCPGEEFAVLPCQNGINRLFGPGPDQWEAGRVATIVGVLNEI